MKNSISSYTQSRDNNFNLMRFVAAFLVLYSHSFALVVGSPDVEPPRALLNMSWGNIAVDVFFVTSGFLIASSFFSRNDIKAFFWARVLRIYPALIVAMIVSVFFIGAIFTDWPLVSYFTEKTTIRYLIKNSLLLLGIEWRLPGVFESNPMRAVNGSLWTLPFEVKMYFWLAVFGMLFLWLKRMFSRVNFRVLFLVLALFAFVSHMSVHYGLGVFPEFLLSFVSAKFIQLFSMYFIGVAFFVYREHIPLDSRIAIPLFATLFLSIFNADLFFIVYSLSLPYLILYTAYVPAGMIRLFNNFGDYSYGLYVYAYPVQQALIALNPNVSIFQMIVLSFAGTMVFAFLSWHLVEKRALSLKGRLANMKLRLLFPGR